MNKKFHEIARKDNNINNDRNFFNTNTRQDKEWKNKNNNDNIKNLNNYNKHSVNLDRELFNNKTYNNYVDNYSFHNERQINDYTYIYSHKNKYNYDNTPGERLELKNSRHEKVPLNLQTQTFVDRSYKINPYVKNNNRNIDRINPINSNDELFEKFDPNKNY
jgi:hypothetical protein